MLEEAGPVEQRVDDLADFDEEDFDDEFDDDFEEELEDEYELSAFTDVTEADLLEDDDEDLTALGDFVDEDAEPEEPAVAEGEEGDKEGDDKDGPEAKGKSKAKGKAAKKKGKKKDEDDDDLDDED